MTGCSVVELIERLFRALLDFRLDICFEVFCQRLVVEGGAYFSEGTHGWSMGIDLIGRIATTRVNVSSVRRVDVASWQQPDGSYQAGFRPIPQWRASIAPGMCTSIIVIMRGMPAAFQIVCSKRPLRAPKGDLAVFSRTRVPADAIVRHASRAPAR
jgi:hypothetical protein